MIPKALGKFEAGIADLFTEPVHCLTFFVSELLPLGSTALVSFVWCRRAPTRSGKTEKNHQGAGFLTALVAVAPAKADLLLCNNPQEPRASQGLCFEEGESPTQR